MSICLVKVIVILLKTIQSPHDYPSVTALVLHPRKDMNPFNFTQPTIGRAVSKSTPASSQSIFDICRRLKAEANVISTFDFKGSLDQLVRHLQATNDQGQRSNYLNQIIATLVDIPHAVLIAILDHQLFTLVRTSLTEVLRQWHRTVHLSETGLFTFWNITKLLRKLSSNTVSLKAYSTWLADAHLLKAVAASLTDLATTNKYFNARELKLFILLLHIFGDCQDWLTTENAADPDRFQALFDPVFKCLTSQHVTDAFLKLDKSPESMSTKEKFFLLRCPNFLLVCEGKYHWMTWDTIFTDAR